jgi:hypothetical protein
VSKPSVRVQQLQAMLDGGLFQCRQRLQGLLLSVERFSEPLPEDLQKHVLMLFDVYCVKFMSEARKAAAGPGGVHREGPEIG